MAAKASNTNSRDGGLRVTPTGAIRTAQWMIVPSADSTVSSQSQELLIDADALDRRLHDLGAQLGAFAQFEEGDALAHGAVFRHVPSGLTHEPHGRSFEGFAPERF